MLTKLRSSKEARSDQVLLQTYTILKQLADTFTHAVTKSAKLPGFLENENTLKDIFTIMNPLLKNLFKKCFPV